MLKPIKEASDYQENWFSYLLKRWVAIDEENKLFLDATRGHGKNGISHYVLVGYQVGEKGSKESDGNGRIGSKIAAWDDQEAIDKANARLAKKKAVRT